MEKVILVNEKDQQTGVMEKMEAHRQGSLHRAFSVFIFNKKGEMLLQRRSMNKYHSAGLWTNACCSHPRPGELTQDAAARRLKEELGFETPLRKIFDFTYHALVENGLTEYEFDHVFFGKYSGEINFNTNEVQEICFRFLSDIESSLQSHPHKFTSWFHIAFPKLNEWMQSGSEF